MARYVIELDNVHHTAAVMAYSKVRLTLTLFGFGGARLIKTDSDGTRKVLRAHNFGEE